TGDADDAARASHIDRVVASGAGDRDVVHLAVAGARAGRALEIDHHPEAGDIGPAEIVDHDVVRAAQCVKIDPLDAVEIHDDVADVAHQPHAGAVGRYVDVLVDVGAVEHERVGAGLPFDRVAAVARIPDECVVAAAELGRVAAAPTVDDVVPVAADQQVVPVATGNGVVAGTAVEGEIDEVGEAVAGGGDAGARRGAG